MVSISTRVSDAKEVINDHLKLLNTAVRNLSQVQMRFSSRDNLKVTLWRYRTGCICEWGIRQDRKITSAADGKILCCLLPHYVKNVKCHSDMMIRGQLGILSDRGEHKQLLHQCTWIYESIKLHYAIIPHEKVMWNHCIMYFNAFIVSCRLKNIKLNKNKKYASF